MKENIPKLTPKSESTEKKYLYHKVPADMKPNEEGKKILYPLNELKERFPEVYAEKMKKYYSEDGREEIPGWSIPTLENTKWGDVLQMSAVHPQDLMDSLNDHDFYYKPMKFYQIDPEKLDPTNTTIFLDKDEVHQEGMDNFTEFNHDNLGDHSTVPQNTKEYYQEISDKNKELKLEYKDKEYPFLFKGVPHIFHRGPIDVSGFEEITAISKDKDIKEKES